ncbi:MAG: hypothetical protein V3V81_04865 [Candidatus Bathyarchaeia archaeon]
MDIRKKHGRKTKLMDIKEIGWTSDMSMKEQLLARLMSGEPYRAVYDSNRSKSSFYQAYNEWSTHAKKRYDDIRRRETELTGRVEELQDAKVVLSQEVTVLQGKAKTIPFHTPLAI